MIFDKDMPIPETVDDYMALIPEKQRIALEELRQQLLDQIPDAVEVISYQIPTIKYLGTSLVAYAAFKKHLSFFVMNVPLVKELAAAYPDVKCVGSTFHFQPDKPLPEELVRRAVEFRMAESQSKAAKKRKKA